MHFNFVPKYVPCYYFILLLVYILIFLSFEGTKIIILAIINLDKSFIAFKWPEL